MTDHQCVEQIRIENRKNRYLILGFFALGYISVFLFLIFYRPTAIYDPNIAIQKEKQIESANNLILAQRSYIRELETRNDIRNKTDTVSIAFGKLYKEFVEGQKQIKRVDNYFNNQKTKKK